MIIESIDDVLTWLVGEKTILDNSVKLKEISKKQRDAAMNKAIDRCVKEILKFKS